MPELRLDGMNHSLNISRSNGETSVPLKLHSPPCAFHAFIVPHPISENSSYPDVPEILTPAALLTMKTMPLHAPPGDFGRPTDIFGYQW